MQANDLRTSGKVPYTVGKPYYPSITRSGPLVNGFLRLGKVPSLSLQRKLSEESKQSAYRQTLGTDSPVTLTLRQVSQVPVDG